LEVLLEQQHLREFRQGAQRVRRPRWSGEHHQLNAQATWKPLLQAADVTTNNYLICLSTVSAQITKLRLIKVSASQ